jgi:hypothetical protein
MWDNIGGKIKVLAKVIAWVGIISSIIGGIILIAIGGNNRYGGGLYIGIGFGTIIVGSLMSWIFSWFMYGFGELIEKTSEIKNHLSGEKHGQKNNKNSNMVTKTIEKKKHLPVNKICSKCGQIVDTGIYISCPNCECEEFIDKKQTENSETNSDTFEGIDIRIGNDKWRCGKCGSVNDIYLLNCKKCNKEQELEE